MDYKGVLHERIRAMAAHLGRESDVLVLAVRPVGAATGWQQPHRFNLVGDRSIPFATCARGVVDTAVAMGNRHQQRSFRAAAAPRARRIGFALVPSAELQSMRVQRSPLSKIGVGVST